MPVGSEEGEGAWDGFVMPDAEGNRVASSIFPPRGDVSIRVKVREGWEGDEWCFGGKEREGEGESKEVEGK